MHVAGNGCPLAEGDGFALGGAIGQRVAADDVFFQHISEALFIANRTLFFAYLVHHFVKQSLAAGFGVVGENVNAIARTDGNQALEFPFGLGFNVFQKGEFAAQDFDKEIAVTAGRLKEAAVEPEGLVAHQIEHSVHLSWIGEHLAMVSHPLAAFDLGLYLFLFGHKKTANFLLSSRS